MKKIKNSCKASTIREGVGRNGRSVPFTYPASKRLASLDNIVQRQGIGWSIQEQGYYKPPGLVIKDVSEPV